MTSIPKIGVRHQTLVRCLTPIFFWVLLASPAWAQELKVLSDGAANARVGIGVAVKDDAPAPDISSVEAFRRTLLAAKSIVYIDPKVGTSGKRVAEVLQRLGIHQISEILPVKGVKLVGELQKYTVYAALPPKDSPQVRALIDHLGGPEAQQRLAAAGYTRPE
jgi:molybdate transport system substrate-binding protein